MYSCEYSFGQIRPQTLGTCVTSAARSEIMASMQRRTCSGPRGVGGQGPSSSIFDAENPDQNQPPHSCSRDLVCAGGGGGGWNSWTPGRNFSAGWSGWKVVHPRGGWCGIRSAPPREFDPTTLHNLSTQNIRYLIRKRKEGGRGWQGTLWSEWGVSGTTLFQLYSGSSDFFVSNLSGEEKHKNNEPVNKLFLPKPPDEDGRAVRSQAAPNK